jgi:uncharacterized cofD-like protein
MIGEGRTPPEANKRVKIGRIVSAFKWLLPGMRVKRWLLLLLLGIVAVGLGLAYVLKDIYETWTFPSAVYYITLQFIDRKWRALIVGGAGLIAVLVAIVQINRSLLAAYVRPGDANVVDTVYRYRQRDRGPKIVAIGGGTGLSTLLRGLKAYSNHITAIVTVADDGGSSGRLRRELGVLPPGDFRNCIAALATDESLTTQLFQYRFSRGAGLEGHSFGNLFIAAMAGITGSSERAILESSRVLATRGQILPSTLTDVTLCADLRETQDEQVTLHRVAGESSIPTLGWPIERVYLEPDNPPAYPGALHAILDADLIVLGPGSLYTSILPNLLVPNITQAIRASTAMKVFVCNVATQHGETDGFSVEDHLRALEMHVGPTLCTYVLANAPKGRPATDANYLMVELRGELPAGCRVLTAGLEDENNPWRHDSARLAKALFDFYVAEHDHAIIETPETTSDSLQ